MKMMIASLVETVTARLGVARLDSDAGDAKVYVIEMLGKVPVRW